MPSPRAHRAKSPTVLPLFAYAMRHVAPADDLARVAERPERVSTGLPTLDRALGGGFPVGLASLLAGPQGAPTTALLMQAVSHALRAHQPVAVFSERMTEEQIKGHLAATEAHVNRYRFRARLVTAEDRMALADAKRRIPWSCLSVLTGRGVRHDVLSEHLFTYRPLLVVADVRPRAPGSKEPLRLEAIMAGVEALAALARRHRVALVARVLLGKGASPPVLGDLPGAGRLAAPFAQVLLLDQPNTESHVDVLVQHSAGSTQTPTTVRLGFDERYDELTC